jgi:catechol 2,3-dioxygenase-like lactoylglutathione lyase family enzyme
MGESATQLPGGWPAHIRPEALRWTWAGRHYEDTISFYRDAVGLPVIDDFVGSFGEDGTNFGLPDTGTLLEVVRARPDQQDRGSFDQLVFDLDDPAAVTAATAPLLERGYGPDPEPHPYWRANGGITYRDPDGRAVVFALGLQARSVAHRPGRECSVSRRWSQVRQSGPSTTDLAGGPVPP